ncbi:MFS family permease [Rubricella aquisinus]|uniref:MFS family permease n=1 Tax=Rubricella aquisinus TaxID=2028108 RepID=A0A840WJI5_9RHOB|nr:MFS transporter [Rubricella aquisinus]MBB5514353.1 MFS family permease [Rubricella aquisinus]
MASALLSRNRNFRLLLSASAASNLGDGVAALAFPWLATLLTRDPLHIALVAFAGQVPWFLFALPAGVLIDRADRRMVIVRADLIRLLLSLCAVALVTMGMGQEGMIFALAALAFLLGTAEVFRDNAAQTFLPSIVDKPDLERANGQLWSVEQIMGAFVGPPLAGLLIAFAVPAPFAFDALMFALSALGIWCILPRASDVPRAARDRFVTEFIGGLRWLRAHALILRLALMLGCLNAMSAMAMTVLVLYSQEVLGLDAVGHGLLLTLGAAGGVVGGVLCPLLAARIGPRASLLLALALMPVPLVLLAVTSSPILAGLALFLEMAAALLWNVVTVSYRQRVIPDALLGRVNSIYRFFGWGTIPLGALAAGFVVTWAEPGMGREAALRLPFWMGATGLAAMFVLGVAILRFPKEK